MTAPVPRAEDASTIRLLGLAFAGADLVFEIDPQGVIVFALGAAERLTGRPDAELVGRDWASLFRTSESALLATLRKDLAAGERRGPIRVELASLSVEDFEAILTSTQASLVKQYAALLATELRPIALDLGRGLADVVNAFNPSLVILGGYFRPMLRLLRTELTSGLSERTMAPALESVRLTLPGLGTDSVLLGAAEIAFEPVFADPVASLATAVTDAQARLAG